MGTPATPAQVLAAVAQFEALKSHYERFMQGLERAEPTAVRETFERLLAALEAAPPRNTAAAFRLQTLRGRVQSYRALWDRQVREREQGSPTLHRSRADVPTAQAPTAGVDRAPAHWAALHQAFVAQLPANAQVVPYDAFCRMVQAHVAKVQAQTGWQAVQLRIDVQAGKPVLRASAGPRPNAADDASEQ